MSLDPGTIFAGHRIEEVAGEGGMGVVYKATQLALDITVALKVMAPELADDDDFRARFQRETKLAAQIDHPNLISVRHAGEEDGLLYVTMRYVEGTDLRRMIAEESPLDPVLVGSVIGQVAAGLAAAHQAGLVHRDVKPANILVERTGEATKAYLTDFGLTRRQAASEKLTKTGSLLGTLDYVAPEQIQGEAIDGRADIYALGCTLYQALTGEPPYPIEGQVPKIFAQLNEPPPSALDRRPDLPPAIDPVIARAMAKQPDDRYPSALDFRRAVAEALEPLTAESPAPTAASATVAAPTVAAPPPAAPPPAAPDTRPPPATRSLRPWLLAGAGAVVIAIIAVILLGGSGGGDGGSDGSGANGKQAVELTPAAFREQADAICTDIERRVEQESAKGLDQAAFLPIRASIVQDGVNELRGIESPPGIDAAKYEQYIETRAEFADGLRQLGGAMAEGRSDVEQITARNEALALKKMEIGRDLELKACADVLPEKDREEVETLGTNWLTGADASSICADQVTATFLESQFGGDEGNCVTTQEATPTASQATLSDLFGVAGVHATATYATESGDVQVETDFEDGAWKVDAIKVGA